MLPPAGRPTRRQPGLPCGLGLAAARLVAGILYRVDRADPQTLAGIAVALLAVALLATGLPALRALRVDPLAPLRRE